MDPPDISTNQQLLPAAGPAPYDRRGLSQRSETYGLWMSEVHTDYIIWTGVLLPLCCDGLVAIVILSMFVCVLLSDWLKLFRVVCECGCVYLFRMD